MSAARRVVPIHALDRKRPRPGSLRAAAEAAADILGGLSFVDEHDAAHARAVLKALRAALGKAGGR